MPTPQIENPQGAFGYLTTVNTPPPGTLHGQTVQRWRNMSTARGIPRCAAVIQGATTSTAAGVDALSTVDEGVYLTTVIGSPLFLGVTLTSCAARTTGSTLNGPAPSSEYVQVVTAGPAWAMLTTVATAPIAGSILTIANATVSGGSTINAGFGGVLGVADTVLITSAAAALIGIAGWCIVPGTSGTTGQLSSVANRGLVWLRPSINLTTRSS